MKLPQFISLIETYSTGQLDETGLNDSLGQFFQQHPTTNPTDLLAEIQILLDDGRLSATQFRLISRMVTELNIQRAMHNLHPTDETLVMPHAPAENSNEETLIMPAGQPPTENPPSTINNAEVHIGQYIKDRFELLELIGKGGMGVVYRAKDLVKVQAQDHNPYIAVKVLSKAFKKYSRAFIALQREASKSQRLAHPNIATVYDFDRDGDIIFMTMELLDGQPFDRLIDEMPEHGLPKEIALGYIADLCNGLAYAHKQNLIHCDLKPANIFLCKSGVVKLLDFGITRPFKQEQDTLQDDTLFDPASLKALTPAYASVEMFKAAPLDPRDDIYSLACVSYELLSGKHPYKRVAAHKALELGLKPEPVKGLSRRQQKALNQALALERDKRTESVEKFLQNIQPLKSHSRQLAIAGSITLLITAAFLVNPVQTQLKEEAQLELIQSIKSGNQSELAGLLANIESRDENSRAYLTSILRKEIIGYYQKRINDAIDARQKRYNYPQATLLLNQVKRLYPDSYLLLEAETQLQAQKKRLIETLVQNHRRLSEQGKDTRRIIEILREADPDHPLLGQ